MFAPSLHTLPPELFYRILDELDAQTILGSLHHVCTQIRAITNTYDRYKLNFSSIPKSDFDFVCQYIRPENVTLLTLYDGSKTPGQIELFVSLFHIDQFTRLRSLTIRYMDSYTLNTILMQAMNCPLESLSIKTRDHHIPDETLDLLGTIISKSSLRQLDISMLYVFIENIPWPSQCSIQHLTIGSCTLEKYKAILRHSPHLRTFILKDYSIRDIDNTVFTPDVSTSYGQLTSLTLKKTQRSMNELELLLSLTPSLVHLKLISDLPASNTLFDGDRWEFFIEQRLPKLEKFEFFFSNTQVREQTINIDSLVARFETPFWLNRKRWFILCDYIPNATRINLYSLPVCETLFLFNLYSRAISRTTSISAANDEALMNNVRTVRMNLTQATIDLSGAQKNECLVRRRLFHQVNELRLIVDGEWPIGSHQFLSALIDLSNIVTIMLGIYFDRLYDQSTVTDIRTLLTQAYNLRSLKFLHSSAIGRYDTALKNVCLMVPHHVKHLQVSVKTLDHMKMVLEQLKHLSSVSFQLNPFDLIICQHLFEWLTQSGRDFAQRQYQCCIQLWLGKITQT